MDQSDLVSANSVMGVHATKLYRPGLTGIVQRDEAIKAGAEGSITVAVLGKKLVIPPDNKSIAELAPKGNARLRSELEPTDKDLIIIGFGKDPGRALAGALAAVLSLQTPSEHVELKERRKLSRKRTAENISSGNELLFGHT